ncbi:hypothetical protein ND898_19155 [Vibrio diabolicus]|uniref:hypothetical protein n=1 Tax=Vibrio harveyi group TaxID=717610 RepID=UPI00216095DC|nr:MULTISPECIES: hypothetical protein [Vibrio harveyi group]MCS0442129.1 hypothetical protein [Vibrio diabolicus]WCZ04251.1 hypothetical protein GSS61_24545 [Vibrio parahaemolyticus]
MTKRLKNSEYASIRGREKRLDAEKKAHKDGVPVPSQPPLFSHDATLQSYFNAAWNSVTPCDISMHLRETKTTEGADLVSKIRNFKACHFR